MAEVSEEIITSTLKKLLRLIAVLGRRDLKQREGIAVLSQAGLGPKEIAEILGTTRNTVNVALANLRKSRAKNRRAPKSTDEKA